MIFRLIYRVQAAEKQLTGFELKGKARVYTLPP